MKREPKIYAIDFDGTLCVDKYPDIGKPRKGVIRKVKRLQKKGHKFILWTCRTGNEMYAAFFWCMCRDVFFAAVNKNLPEMVEKYGADPRKIGADKYIDDKAVRW